MKALRILSMALLTGAAPLHAETVIYRHDFGGSSTRNLAGTAVETSSEQLGGTSGAEWTGSAVFRADGSFTLGGGDSSANVPFRPVDGYLYTISVETTAAAVATNPTTSLSYVGVALYNGETAPSNSLAVGSQRVIAPITRSPDNTPNASSAAGPFNILRRWHRDTPHTTGTSLTQNHLASVGTNAGTWRLSIQLDTSTPGNWKYRWLVEDVATSTVLSRSHADGATWPSVGSLTAYPINRILLCKVGPFSSGAFDNFLVSATPKQDDTGGGITHPEPVVIDRDFPGGNIRVTALTQQSHASPRKAFLDRELRPEDRDWFYWSFRTRDTTGFTAVFSDRDQLGPRGAAVSHDGGATWSHLGGASVVQQNIGGVDHWTFEVPPVEAGKEVRYSFSAHYLQSHLETWLSAHAGNPHVDVSELCRSRKDRSVELVRVGRPLSAASSEIIFLTGRHHCCETCASYVMEGILDAGLADDDIGKQLRKRTLLAVPFVDKDGVEEGDQGKDRIPHDHNRDYGPTPIYPEVSGIKRFGTEHGRRVVTFLDLHCPVVHGTWDKRLHFYESSDTRHAGNLHAFISVLMNTRTGEIPLQADDFLAYGGSNNSGNYSDRSRGWAETAFPDARLISTLEIPYAEVRGVELTVARARNLGRDIARALVAHLPPVEVTGGQLWRELAFGADAENPAVGGWLADPDHDGITNIIEYAFNLPASGPVAPAGSGAAVSGIPSVGITRDSGNPGLRLEYLRRKSTSDPGVSYTPEVSENLSSSGEEGWRPATGPEDVTSIDSTWERVSVQLPADKPARFARVRVTTIP
ncbi:hypothetical protein OVA24_21085 [Luteolibacter sp. SL250]|uniref:hypothetical protein n=1 Tax=Luteolibacter sp. SL250 TaxID=2995170 RepID=UPI00226DF357|nr:hypothetical protein [Luteolibacter sp. SL250]WAC19717.1 hypothetical protein OVA24_21085 [Luteolibacter sp. SL250]